MIPCGPKCPVGIVGVMMRLGVSTTETVLLPVLETYTFSLSGVSTNRIGDLPTGTAVVTWLAAESITATGLERSLSRKAADHRPSCHLRNFRSEVQKSFSVVRTSLSLAVTLRKEGQVELGGDA